MFQPKGQFAARRDVTLFAMWEYRRLLYIDPSIMWCQTGGWWGEENDGSDRCSLTAIATMVSINTGIVVVPSAVEVGCESLMINDLTYNRSNKYSFPDDGSIRDFGKYYFTTEADLLVAINYEINHDRAVVVHTNGSGEHWVTVTKTTTGKDATCFKELMGIDPWFNGSVPPNIITRHKELYTESERGEGVQIFYENGVNDQTDFKIGRNDGYSFFTFFLE